MVEKVIWPAYLDATKSRSEGRRVPQDDAVSEPTVDEIATAVQQIGYDSVVERNAAYPRESWHPTGRVRVKNADDASKNDLIRAVSAYVAVLRE